jgi:predicted O-linked N-acetylglucosamine transferase (SPINDLY family)
VSYAEDAPVLTRQQLGLPEDAFVMASFGNTYKITPEMFATWMRLLHRLPNAVLWLIDDNEASTANLSARAAEAGVDVSRIHFSPRTTHSEFCGRLKLADVFLDTYPYNCGSTSNDVINAGIELVTMSGKTLVARINLNLLEAQGGFVKIIKTLREYELRVQDVCSRKNQINNDQLQKIKKINRDKLNNIKLTASGILEY